MEILLKINSNLLKKDNKNIIMDTTPYLDAEKGRTMVPFRAISEAFGYDVQWINDTQEIIIRDRKKYFETVDECAFDWCMHWNCMSIALFKEMGAIIYKDDNGYYWDNIHVSTVDDKEFAWDMTKVKKGVAFIHSHGGGEHWVTKSMSKGDKDSAKKCKRPLYMVDSGGCLWVYDPAEENPKQKLVKEGLPKDIRWMDIKDSSEAQKKYFSTGYNCLDEYEYGYKADYYNKIHMRGLNYLREEIL